nr:DUF3050 domain-containing protein [uncultured Psychroserpens sp.]
MNYINKIETSLQPLREELKNHRLYNALTSIEDIQLFMEQHVFAVWDFMSLLKALQNHLTTTTVPWTPPQNPATSRFINEIVLGEESDVNELGEPKSHFEMYLDAMDQIGANKTQINAFINSLYNNLSVSTAVQNVDVQNATQQFVNFTFKIIAANEPHKIASAFTFGREDLIPDMFFQIINKSQGDENSYSKLTYYLKRHIELDGDEHGPLSLKMIEELCGENQQKWNEVLDIAQNALQQRITLWDGIYNLINEKNCIGA